MLHTVGDGLKATCKAHTKCFCWVSCPIDKRLDVLVALTKWIAESEAHGPDKHYDKSVELKRSFGMKVRG